MVVDPGVGTSRAALAVESDGRFLVGPDNGVLSPALLRSDVRVVELPIPPVQAGPRPNQPNGREPAHREPRS